MTKKIKKPVIRKTPVKSPLRIGNKVFIRAVTHYLTGEIVAVSRDEVLLVSAAWIADTGRWFQALSTGVLNEVEPYPDGLVVGMGRGAIVDYCDWKHDLPRAQK